MSSKSAYMVLGTDTPRKDGLAKVTGQEKYASDSALPQILHARMLKAHPLSPE